MCIMNHQILLLLQIKSSLTRMWHYSIREWMLTHVSISIRCLGSTKTTRTCTCIVMDLTEHRICTYSQREPHDVTKRWVAILAVIQQRHTKAMLRKIPPLVATHLIQQGPTISELLILWHCTLLWQYLKLSLIPGGIKVCRAWEVAKLNLILGLVRVNIEGKLHFQKLMALLPIYLPN